MVCFWLCVFLHEYLFQPSLGEGKNGYGLFIWSGKMRNLLKFAVTFQRRVLLTRGCSVSERCYLRLIKNTIPSLHTAISNIIDLIYRDKPAARCHHQCCCWSTSTQTCTSYLQKHTASHCLGQWSPKWGPKCFFKCCCSDGNHNPLLLKLLYLGVQAPTRI